MRVSAAILLIMLTASPAMAIDIVSGSGAVVKNGSGMTVINGDSCSGQMKAACLDRGEDRRDRNEDVVAAAEPTGTEIDDPDCVAGDKDMPPVN